MLKMTIKVEGLRELDAALGELPKATGKNVLRRGMRKALQPMADVAEGNAPEKTGKLKRGIKVGTTLSRSQRKAAKETKSYVEVYMGPDPSAKAIAQEFGTVDHAPHAYMRPAWEQENGDTLERFKAFTWEEVKSAATRLARKAARQAAKLGG